MSFLHIDMTQAGLGSIQFRNWNCSSIPIPELELELELKLVELKMELELKTLELELELELKTGIEFFATATAAITSYYNMIAVFFPDFDRFIPGFDRFIPGFDRFIPASIPVTGTPPYNQKHI